MIQGSLARRYAKALFQIALESKALPVVRKELALAGDFLRESPILFQTLCNRTISITDRKAILRTVAEKSDLSLTTKNFLYLLLDKERFSLFHAIARETVDFMDSEGGVLRAQVRTARPLAAPVRQELVAALSTATGKTIAIETQVDPNLLAGICAKIGHTLYDGTVSTQLENLRKRMLQKSV